MVRYSAECEKRAGWGDTDKPLRAAPKLKPPALPGDTYYKMLAPTVIGRSHVHCGEDVMDRVGVGRKVEVPSPPVCGVGCSGIPGE